MMSDRNVFDLPSVLLGDGSLYRKFIDHVLIVEVPFEVMGGRFATRIHVKCTEYNSHLVCLILELVNNLSYEFLLSRP